MDFINFGCLEPLNLKFYYIFWSPLVVRQLEGPQKILYHIFIGSIIFLCKIYFIDFVREHSLAWNWYSRFPVFYYTPFYCFHCKVLNEFLIPNFQIDKIYVTVLSYWRTRHRKAENEYLEFRVIFSRPNKYTRFDAVDAVIKFFCKNLFLVLMHASRYSV